MTSVDVAEGRRLCEAAEGDEYAYSATADEDLGVWARNNLPALLTAHEAALERVRVLEEAANPIVAHWQEVEGKPSTADLDPPLSDADGVCIRVGPLRALTRALLGDRA